MEQLILNKAELQSLEVTILEIPTRYGMPIWSIILNAANRQKYSIEETTEDEHSSNS